MCIKAETDRTRKNEMKDEKLKKKKQQTSVWKTLWGKTKHPLLLHMRPTTTMKTTFVMFAQVAIYILYTSWFNFFPQFFFIDFLLSHSVQAFRKKKKK